MNDLDSLFANGSFQLALLDGRLDHLHRTEPSQAKHRPHDPYFDDQGSSAVGDSGPFCAPMDGLAAGNTGAGAAAGGKRGSRIILIPPSPRAMMRAEEEALKGEVYGRLRPNDAGTPPTIMLTPASNPSTERGEASPVSAVLSPSASPAPTAAAGSRTSSSSAAPQRPTVSVSPRPQSGSSAGVPSAPASPTNTPGQRRIRMSAGVAALLNRTAGSGAGPPTSGSGVAGARASGLSRVEAQAHEATSPGGATEAPPSIRAQGTATVAGGGEGSGALSSSCHQQPASAAPFASISSALGTTAGASETRAPDPGPTDPAKSLAGTTAAGMGPPSRNEVKAEDTPSPSPSRPQSEALPQPPPSLLQLQQQRKSSSHSHRESSSTVDSLPFGVTSSALPSQSLSSSLINEPSPSEASREPVRSSVGLPNPPPRAPASSQSNPSSSSAAGHKSRPPPMPRNDSSSSSSTAVDSPLRASTSLAKDRDDNHDDRNDHRREEDLSKAINDLPATPVIPTPHPGAPTRREIDELLTDMGLSPKHRKREPITMFDRAGKEFTIEEHTLSPVTERTELSSTISSRKSMPHPFAGVQSALGFAPAHGFSSPSFGSGSHAPRGPSNPDPAPVTRIRAGSLETAGSNGSEEDRTKQRRERRDRTSTAEAQRSGTTPTPPRTDSPSKRTSSPTKSLASSARHVTRRKSAASSLASTLGDVEIVHSGELHYLNADSASIPPTWIECAGILTKEALYLAARPAQMEPLEFNLKDCWTVEPVQSQTLPEAPGGGKMRAMRIRWNDGHGELMGCKKAKARTDWAEKIQNTVRVLNGYVDSPEQISDTPSLLQRLHPGRPREEAERRRPGSSSGSDASPGDSTPTLRSQLRHELNAAGRPTSSDTERLYDDGADHMLGHSVGATHQSLSPDEMKHGNDLFGRLQQLQYPPVHPDEQPQRSGSAGNGKARSTSSAADSHVKAAASVKHRRDDSEATSLRSEAFEGLGAGPNLTRELRRIRSAVEAKPAAGVPDQTAQHIGAHLSNIHQLIEGVAAKLRGHEAERENPQTGEEPTIADKVDYMLSLCNILLESQHKVSAAVERNLKAHGLNVEGKASRSRMPSTKAAGGPSKADAAEKPVAAAAPDVSQVRDVGLERIENTLAVILAKLDQQPAKSNPSPQRGGHPTARFANDVARQEQHPAAARFTADAHPDFDPPTRPHTVAEGVRFSEPQWPLSPSASDAQSIIGIEADVALWKSRERGVPLSQLGTFQQRESSNSSLFPPMPPHVQVQSPLTETMEAEKIAENRARAERRLEGHRSPMIGVEPYHPPPRMSPSGPMEQSKWSTTTPRDSSPVMMRKGTYDTSGFITESAIMNGEGGGETFSPSTAPPSVAHKKFSSSLPLNIQRAIEAALAKVQAQAQPPAQGQSQSPAEAQAINPAMEEMVRVLKEQREATARATDHQAQVGQYLGQLSHFWEGDLVKRNEDSRNLADGLSRLQDQVTVLAERIADAFVPPPQPAQGVQAAQPAPPVKVQTPPPPIETNVPTNNASSDSLPPPLPKKASFAVDSGYASEPEGKPEKRMWTPSPRLTKQKKPSPPKRSASKTRKIDYGKSFRTLDIGSKLSSMGRLWGGPVPAANREERWGTKGPALLNKLSPPPEAAPKKSNLKRSNSSKKAGLDMDLNAVLSGLNPEDPTAREAFAHQLEQRPGKVGVASILSALRQQKASEEAQRKEEEKLKANMPSDPKEMNERRAQIEELQRRRAAEIAQEKAKGLEAVVEAYREQVKENEKQMQKLAAELEAHKKTETKGEPEAQAQARDLEDRVAQLRMEEAQMRANVRDLAAMLPGHPSPGASLRAGSSRSAGGGSGGGSGGGGRDRRYEATPYQGADGEEALHPDDAWEGEYDHGHDHDHDHGHDHDHDHDHDHTGYSDPRTGYSGTPYTRLAGFGMEGDAYSRYPVEAEAYHTHPDHYPDEGEYTPSPNIDYDHPYGVRV